MGRRRTRRGDPDATVEHVHLAVDAVPATAREAVELGAGLLLTHHPLLLRGVTTIAESTYKGSVLATLVRGGSALVAAHTNADVVTTGTSAVLADRTRAHRPAPARPGSGPDSDPDDGHRPCRASSPRAPRSAPSHGSSSTCCRPPPPACASPATSTSPSAPWRSAPARATRCSATPPSSTPTSYITSDLRHHPASEFREQALLGGGPALIDTSHWATEWLWLDVAAEQLRDAGRRPGHRERPPHRPVGLRRPAGRRTHHPH